MLPLSLSPPALGRLARSCLLLAVAAAAAIGCASPLPSRVQLPAHAPEYDRAELQQAVEAFYTAETATELRAATARAHKAAPASAAFHELAAQLAELDADRAGVFEHWRSAALDPDSDAPGLTLMRLESAVGTRPEVDRAAEVLRAVSRQHSNASVRAHASHVLSNLLRQVGELEASREVRKQVGLSLPLALVGPWDNDQGQAFESSLPPEREIELSARYPGSLTSIGWREQPPEPTHYGAYPMGQLFSPNEWAVAYGLGAVRVAKAGDYELRLDTGVATKIWVNGSLVYSERFVNRSQFDQMVVPVKLKPGVSRILIKSAQTRGFWALGVRLTERGGEPPSGVAIVASGAEPTAGATEGEPWTTAAMVEARAANVGLGETRKAFLRWRWATLAGFRHQGILYGDAFLKAHPQSLMARHALAEDLRDEGQRGRASDLLSHLDAEAGDALPLIRLQHARFLQQEGLSARARELVVEVRASRPTSPLAWLRQAEHFRHMGWLEDRCLSLAEANRLRPQWLTGSLRLANCWREQGYKPRAIERLERTRRSFGGELSVLRPLQKAVLEQGDLARAEALAKRMTELGGDRPWVWQDLAESRRLAGDAAGARAALQQGLSVNPDKADLHEALGRLAYEGGDKARAVAHWQATLDRNPDDGDLANRLDFLDPGAKEPWQRDIPGDEPIRAAVRAGGQVKPPEGADTLELLDHEVTRLRPDGSTTNVVTRVVRALNTQGRDAITRHSLRPEGRLRVLRAYAIDSKGRHIQATSTRGRTARFRGLDVGATVVLQYRNEAPPVDYLAQHMARGFFFQARSQHTVHSEWAVWAASGTRFHEWLRGDVERTEETVGDQLRVAWVARDQEPLVAEPDMPPARDLAASLLLSTVPDWETFVSWERALLQKAFVPSAEVESLAKRLLQGIDEPRARLERIHRYLMEEIRYQQDYETSIAGVKPHPASVVVRRGYGDCKDKAVLFITLARLAGLEAHFALLRTRPQGELRREVPMQQFNHAIVLVPAQQGLESRFYDPTADALDLGVLRADDVGALALVVDPRAEGHEWVPIPFQGPEAHEFRIEETIALTRTGEAELDMAYSARGSHGSSLRRLVRNQSHFEQAMDRFVGAVYSGATLSEGPVAHNARELSEPAVVTLKAKLPNYARREGRELRVRATPVFFAARQFGLSKRRFDLVLGAPKRRVWTTELVLPPGATVRRLPETFAAKAECFAVERNVSRTDDRLRIEQRYDTTCERIAADQYASYRQKAREVERLLAQDIVLE